jgi:hypothetical protein
MVFAAILQISQSYSKGMLKVLAMLKLQQAFKSVGFGILTVMTMKSPVICSILPCNLVKVSWCFGGTYRPDLKG